MARVRDKDGTYESTKGKDPKKVEEEDHSKEDEDMVSEEENDVEKETNDTENEETKSNEEEEVERAENEDDEETKSNEEEEVERAENVSDEEEENDASEPTAPSEDDDDMQPPQPEKLFFGQSEYQKSCKIATRCSVKQVVQYIEEEFPSELKWFRKHDQFKHVFHMHRQPNHMLQGMWMLLLRTACTEKENECWFVVNGVPVRYSIKEHALLTGLNCHDYPVNWKKLGDIKFIEKIFKKKKGIKISDMEEKLEEMMKKKGCIDRKKLIILYFLCKVVKAKSKSDGNIDPFLLSVVDDVDACETFPWGRFTFDDLMEEIRRFVKSFKGEVKPRQQASFSGFIFPLEVLAFECIPHLGCKFRDVVTAEKDCPRLCKHKFSKSCMKSFPLEDINEELGNTKDITSILEADSYEKAMLMQIIPDSVDDGIGFIDSLVESWVQRLTVQGKKICWKDLYELDMAARSCEVPHKVDGAAKKVDGVPIASLEQELKKMMEKCFEDIYEKLDVMEKRLKEVEDFLCAVQLVAGEQSETVRDAEAVVEEEHPSGVPDPMDVQISEKASGVRDAGVETEMQGKKQKGKGKRDKKERKDNGVEMENGQRRTRQSSRLIRSPYVAEPKRMRKTRE